MTITTWPASYDGPSIYYSDSFNLVLTQTFGTSITSYTASPAYYIQVGSLVTIYSTISLIVPTFPSGEIILIDMDLPVSSNFSGFEDATGSLSLRYGGGVSNKDIYTSVSSSSSNNKITFSIEFPSSYTGNETTTFSLICTYIVK